MGSAGIGGMIATDGHGAPTGTGGTIATGGHGGPTGELCTPNLGSGNQRCPAVTVCWNTCGPDGSGYRNCVCQGGPGAPANWVCEACTYLPERDYACFKIPAALQACPPDISDTERMLPLSGTPCALPACQPCGSSTNNAYRDSANTPKVGYCVCIGGPTGGYSCASAAEWPPQ